MNKQCGLLINASRSILFAGNQQDFAAKAAEEAKNIQSEMEKILTTKGLL